MISVDENLCVGCAMCVPYCPEDAISCYGLAEVNEDCIDCLTCLEYCPVDALKEAVLENGDQ
jgi:NAD-dependent dihydropyrimidine dehydrogenase PreA subunit